MDNPLHSLFYEDLDVQKVVIEAAERMFSELVNLLDEDHNRDMYYGPGVGTGEADRTAYLASKCYTLYLFLREFSSLLPQEESTVARINAWLDSNDYRFHVCPMCSKWYPLEWFTELRYTNSRGTEGNLCLRCEKASTLTEEPFDPGEVG